MAVENQVEKTTVHFQVEGENITRLIRGFWHENEFARCLKVLSCFDNLTLDDKFSIVMGEKRFDGVNELSLIDDDWELPDGYVNFEDFITRATEFSKYQEGAECKAEDLVWRALKSEVVHLRSLDWEPTRDTSKFNITREQLLCRARSIVGEDKVNEMYNRLEVDFRFEYEEEKGNWRKAADKWYSNEKEIIELENSRSDTEDEAIDTPESEGGLLSAAYASIAIMHGIDPDALQNRGYDREPTLDKDMNSPTGWLLPRGKYYACDSMEHVGQAYELLKGEIPDTGEVDYDREASRKNWVKIARSMGKLHILPGKRGLTKTQRTRLFDYAQRHGLDFKKMMSTYSLDLD